MKRLLLVSAAVGLLFLGLISTSVMATTAMPADMPLTPIHNITPWAPSPTSAPQQPYFVRWATPVTFRCYTSDDFDHNFYINSPVLNYNVPAGAHYEITERVYLASGEQTFWAGYGDTTVPFTTGKHALPSDVELGYALQHAKLPVTLKVTVETSIGGHAIYKSTIVAVCDHHGNNLPAKVVNNANP